MEEDEVAGEKQRRRHWVVHTLIWAGLALLTLLLFLAISHGAIVRWLMNHQVPRYLQRHGMDVNWHVSGNVRGNLRFDNVEITSDSSPLARLEATEIYASYDVTELWKAGLDHMPRTARVDHLRTVIDLTRVKNTAKEKAKTGGTPFNPALLDIPPPDVRVENSSADIVTNAGTWRAHSVNLDLSPAGAGTLDAALATPFHPDRAYRIRAEFTWRNRSLRITRLDVDGRPFIKQLDIYLPDGPERVMNFAAVLEAAGATLAARGSYDPRSNVIGASVALRSLTAERLKPFLELPFTGGLKELNLRVDGDPAQPRALEFHANAAFTPLVFSKARFAVDRARLLASSDKRDWKVSALNVEAGPNAVLATASAPAPATWADVGLIDARGQAILSAPEVRKLPLVPPKLLGSAAAILQAHFADKKLQQYSVALRGLGIGHRDIKTDWLSVTAVGSAELVNFNMRAFTDKNTLKVNAEGSLGLTGDRPVKLKWAAKTPRPANLAAAFGLPWPGELRAGALETQGEADGDLTPILKGDVASADASADVTIRQVTWKNAPCEEGAFRATVKDGRAEIKEVSLALSSDNNILFSADAPAAPLLSRLLGADAAFEPGQGHAKLTIDLSNLAVLAPWFAATGTPLPRSGSLKFVWDAIADFEPNQKMPLVSATATAKLTATKLDGVEYPVSAEVLLDHSLNSMKLSKIAADIGPWHLDGAVSADLNRVTLHQVVLSHDGVPLLGGQAGLPFAPSEPLTLKINTQSALSLAELHKITGFEFPLQGSFEIQTDLHGPAGALTGFVSLKGSDLREKEPKYLDGPGALDLRADFLDGRATLKSVLDAKPLQPLTIEAHSVADPLAWSKNPDSFWATPFEGKAVLPPTSLAFLQKHIPGCSGVDGKLSAHLDTGGTFRSPSFRGSVDIVGGAFSHKNLDMPQIKDFVVHIVGEKTKLRVETFQASVSGGTVKLAGDVDLVDVKNPVFNLSGTARQALLKRDDTMLMRADADLTCRGALQQAAVAGRVSLTNSRIFKEIEYAPLARAGELPPIPPPPPGPPKDPNAPAMPPPFDKWTFQVAITTTEPLRLMGNLVNGEVTAKLNLGGDGSRPFLTGRADFDKTRLRFPFSTLEVENGAILFNGKYPPEPTLELKATSQVNGYDVVLRGYGPAMDPKIVFTSSPPLADGDIATLLATGQTASALQGGGEGLEGQAAFYVLSQAYRKMFKKDLYDASKPPKFSVSHSTVGGGLGGIVGTYKTSDNTRLESTIRADGGFRSVFRYLFRFH